MADRPLISIVVPVYNGARFLTATLQSILTQTESRWECVVVDDGSQDNSLGIARSFADVHPRIQAVSQLNGGPCAARNYGYSYIDPASQFVCFMDSDDLWLPDALASLRTALEIHTGAVGAHGLAEFIEADGELLHPGQFSSMGRKRLGYDGRRLSLQDRASPTTFRTVATQNVMFPPGVVMVRRSALDLAGKWDVNILRGEDWDMWTRTLRQGYFHFVDRVLLHYRRHESNFGATRETPAEAHRVLVKTFYSRENTPEQRRICRGSWRAYQLQMAAHRAGDALRRLRQGDTKQGINLLARVPVHLWRYFICKP